jgi:putative aldouronate transport system permease protein
MIHSFFIALSIAVIVPFILIISISLTSEQSLLLQGYHLIPRKLDLLAYKTIFEAPTQLIRSYGVTIFVTIFGTVVSLLLTTMIAYSLSRRDYRYRKITTFYVFLTMLFNGGLVPLYILVTQYLHMKDTIYALIVPYLISPFYVLIMKGFLDKLPAEIIESAKIDGSNEWRIFFKIVLPLSTPALATVGLFISFMYWNDWWLGLLFIDNQRLIPLQLLLYRIMSTIEFLSNNVLSGAVNIDIANFPNLSARMAMAILAAGPMMFVFPFFQRYFIRGLTVGSLKA